MLNQGHIISGEDIFNRYIGSSVEEKEQLHILQIRENGTVTFKELSIIANKLILLDMVEE